jgi:hypothetical protein
LPDSFPNPKSNPLPNSQYIYLAARILHILSDRPVPPAQIQAHACIGGKSVGDDIRKLDYGQHIVSGTPGRVFDMIRRRNLRTRNIKTLILDEADEMLNQGFKDQIYDVYRYLPPQIQVRAAFSPPDPSSGCLPRRAASVFGAAVRESPAIACSPRVGPASSLLRSPALVATAGPGMGASGAAYQLGTAPAYCASIQWVLTRQQRGWKQKPHARSRT